MRERARAKQKDRERETQLWFTAYEQQQDMNIVNKMSTNDNEIHVQRWAKLLKFIVNDFMLPMLCFSLCLYFTHSRSTRTRWFSLSLWHIFHPSIHVNYSCKPEYFGAGCFFFQFDVVGVLRDIPCIKG